MIWKYFVRPESSSDHGTAYQLRNLLGRSNVVTKPKKNLNACEDFLILLLRAYVTYAAMDVLQMENVDDAPNTLAEDLWLKSNEYRRKVLDSILTTIIDKFVDVKYNSEPMSSKDVVFSYAKQLISIGCLYMEFADGVKEGDGERVLRCWRYFMVAFRNSNRKNYALEAVQLLYQYHYVMSPQLSEEMIFARFINVRGFPGRNISMDLHMEHLNREIKNGIDHLGCNKTKSAITRLGKVIGSLTPILNNFDEENDVKEHHTRHKAPSDKDEVYKIVDHLKKHKVFCYCDGRKYSYFRNVFTSLLHKSKENELVAWITTHIN